VRGRVEESIKKNERQWENKGGYKSKKRKYLKEVIN